MADNAQMVSIMAPDSVAAGTDFTATITMRNTGDTIWSFNGAVRLGSESPRDTTRWGLTRLVVPHDVSPQQTVAFTGIFRAPAVTGPQTFAWGMLREGIAWFGSVATKSINVIAAPILSPLPPPRANPADIQSVRIIDTNPYKMSLTGKVATNVRWANETGDILRIVKADLWTGMDFQPGATTRADIFAGVQRVEDASFLAMAQYDRYAYPAGAGDCHRLFEYDDPGFLLYPEERLQLAYFAQQFEPASVALHAHHSLTIWYYRQPVI